jgi:hypothetical protein
MAYKVNYGLERAERNRAKQAKKEAKLRDRKAGVVAEADEPAEPTPDPAPPEAAKDA